MVEPSNPLIKFFSSVQSKGERLSTLRNESQKAAELKFRETLRLRQELGAKIFQIEEEPIICPEERKVLKEFLLNNVEPRRLGSFGRSAQKLGVRFKECVVSGDFSYDGFAVVNFIMSYSYSFRVSHAWLKSVIYYYVPNISVRNPYIDKKEKEVQMFLEQNTEWSGLADVFCSKFGIANCRVSLKAEVFLGNSIIEDEAKESIWHNYICSFTEKELRI